MYNPRLIKYCCTLLNNDQQEKVETCGSSIILFVKALGAFVVIFLNFIDVISKVGGLVAD